MDWVDISARIQNLIKKYKYVVLVLLIGIVLMVIPAKEGAIEETIPIETEAVKEDISKQLEDTLRKMEGVGDVKVLLTEYCSEETVFQTDMSQTGSESGENIRTETVIISSSNRNQTGLVSKVMSPVYMGAIVICQGGDHPSVQLAVTEAIADATGLKTDRISVLKMK